METSALLSVIDRATGRKINKTIVKLNCTINQFDLTEIYRLFYPTVAKYTLFLSSHGEFTKIDQILDHKINHSKIVLEYNGIMLEHNSLIQLKWKSLQTFGNFKMNFINQ